MTTDGIKICYEMKYDLKSRHFIYLFSFRLKLYDKYISKKRYFYIIYNGINSIKLLNMNFIHHCA